MEVRLTQPCVLLHATRVITLFAGLGSMGLGAACSQIPLDTTAGNPVVALRGQSGGTLQNKRIEARWTITDGRLSSLAIRDWAGDSGVMDATLNLDGPFSIELREMGVLHASDLLIASPAKVEQLTPNPSASRASDRLPGVAIHYQLSDPEGRFGADWALTLRRGSSYIRQILTITAGPRPLPLSGVTMIDVRSPGIGVAGTVKGSPLTAGDFFLGFESPLSESSVVAGRGVSELHSGVPISAGQSAQFSSVVGVAPRGQMRRAFLTYLERERAHPYRTFLHYNSWFDIGFFNPYTQQEALARIHAFGEALNKKRGVKLDSFLFDDGWDDTNDLWKIRTDFKDGFDPLKQAAAEYGTAPGVWLSPWGGYGPAKQARVATARRDGYEIVDEGLALSGPRYYALFHDAVTGMVTKYGVNQFKLDGTGNADQVVKGSAFSSDFDAAIHLIGDLRQLKPDLYINLTTGTWPSPFWLFYADSIWRGGDDTEFAGVGSDRERWITYRDADTYGEIVKAGRLFPLNSLMLHGVVFAQKAPHLATDPGGDFANEVRSYFGTGTQLQEMYITPSLLTEADWNVLAESAKWSRRNAATLVDTHWVGGDPRWLQVYGWAAWSPQKAILTLRNPSAHAQDSTLDVAQAFELPAGAATRFSAHGPWSADAAQPAIELEAGKPHTFHLEPFQVLTLEAVPQT
ncbi:MAG: enterotoxin [Terracidiphilus sp.]|nr:enterotoxin [Terracidiphilus sp.]